MSQKGVECSEVRGRTQAGTKSLLAVLSPPTPAPAQAWWAFSAQNPPRRSLWSSPSGREPSEAESHFKERLSWELSDCFQEIDFPCSKVISHLCIHIYVHSCLNLFQTAFKSSLLLLKTKCYLKSFYLSHSLVLPKFEGIIKNV